VRYAFDYLFFLLIADETYFLRVWDWYFLKLLSLLLEEFIDVFFLMNDSLSNDLFLILHLLFLLALFIQSIADSIEIRLL